MTKKLCFYSCCNTGYIPYAIQSLYSIYLLHPEYDYYVVSDCSDEKYVEMCKRFNITLKTIDIHHHFHKNTSRHWPSYCFWILYGIHIFEKEYDYCCSVDGDIYCHKPLSLDFLSPEKDIYLIQTRRHLNSGVVFYNIKTLMEKGFFDTVLVLYNKTKFPSDQHLLIEWTKQYNNSFQIQYLNSRYNYVLGKENIHTINIPRLSLTNAYINDDSKKEEKERSLNPTINLDICIYHFVYKWWSMPNVYSESVNHIYKYAYKLHTNYLYTHFSKEEEIENNDDFKILLFNKIK